MFCQPSKLIHAWESTNCLGRVGNEAGREVKLCVGKGAAVVERAVQASFLGKVR